MTQKTEKEKFLEWYEDQKKTKGLTYYKPIVDRDPETGRPILPPGTTEEDLYGAMNALNAAVERGDYKVVTDL